MNEVHINCRVCKGLGNIEFERGMRVKPCQMCRATGRDAYAERAALEVECKRLREFMVRVAEHADYWNDHPYAEVVVGIVQEWREYQAKRALAASTGQEVTSHEQ